ncbi:hypothetical protein BC833DRAFT_599261 [Globomyces pollinis-pini]|nr:hypothetical protein BC833DRAFT_599261 [Globomyces pollinis-pini]KAJ2993619.1 hypothetical protein HDV02_002220 [Globomyces sp. JEL0801]
MTTIVSSKRTADIILANENKRFSPDTTVDRVISKNKSTNDLYVTIPKQNKRHQSLPCLKFQPIQKYQNTQRISQLPSPDEDDHPADLKMVDPAPAAVASPATNRSRGLSFETSEFVAFAIIRLWTLKGIYTPPPAKLPLTTYPSDRKFISPSGFEHVFPSLVKRVHHVLERTGMSLEIIMTSLLYLFRVRNSIKNEVTLGTEFQVFVTSLILAHKMNTDERYSNKAWSNVVGFSTTQLNVMEREFLSQINNNLHIKHEHYQQWIYRMQLLGKERLMIKRGVMLSMERFQQFCAQHLSKRADLILEIKWVRQYRQLF